MQVLTELVAVSMALPWNSRLVATAKPTLLSNSMTRFSIKTHCDRSNVAQHPGRRGLAVGVRNLGYSLEEALA